MRLLPMMTLPVLLTSTLVFGAGPTPPSEFDACFNASAKKWSVPAALLKALAKEETDGFHNIPDAQDADQDHPKFYGIMGLRNDAVMGRTLEEAALLSGHSVKDLTQNPCANIDGAAALLSNELKRNGNNIANALMHYWNSASPKETADGIHEVTRILKAGTTGRVTLAPAMELSGLLASDFKTASDLETKGIVLGSQGSSGGTDYSDADWDASANFTEGDITPHYIVMHTTEGAFNGAVSWLKSPKSGVSAHYVIRKSDGYIKQLVHEHDRAYHARCWNVEAIGVEMEGFLKDDSTFTSTLLDAASKLVQDIARRHKIRTDDLHIIGHNFGDTDKIKQTPLQKCNDHTDPGRYFPWSNFLGMLDGDYSNGGPNGGDRGDNGGDKGDNGGGNITPPKSCSWWQLWCHN